MIAFYQHHRQAAGMMSQRHSIGFSIGYAKVDRQFPLTEIRVCVGGVSL